MSRYTIQRILKQRRWSRKVVKARAAERSEALRTQWRGIQALWESDQLIFLDESGCNERTGDRKFGWSPIGIMTTITRCLKRSERWSILPALSIDGYIAHVIYQGSIDKE